jgi:hypothetical protein
MLHVSNDDVVQATELPVIGRSDFKFVWSSDGASFCAKIADKKSRFCQYKAPSWVPTTIIPSGRMNLFSSLNRFDKSIYFQLWEPSALCRLDTDRHYTRVASIPKYYFCMKFLDKNDLILSNVEYLHDDPMNYMPFLIPGNMKFHQYIFSIKTQKKLNLDQYKTLLIGDNLKNRGIDSNVLPVSYLYNASNKTIRLGLLDCSGKIKSVGNVYMGNFYKGIQMRPQMNEVDGNILTSAGGETNHNIPNIMIINVKSLKQEYLKNRKGMRIIGRTPFWLDRYRIVYISSKNGDDQNMSPVGVNFSFKDEAVWLYNLKDHSNKRIFSMN